jgi:hypothetical protein
MGRHGLGAAGVGRLKTAGRALALVSCWLVASTTTTPSEASDHIDGVKTALDNAADVTDVYTFTSPSDAGKLVLIMNVHGVAFSRSRFSNAVDYRFRIRPIENAETLEPSADPRKEQTFTCNFSGGLHLVKARQRATCTYDYGSGRETVTFETRSNEFRAGGSGGSASARIFAGVRSDSWFLDLAKTLKWNKGLPVLGTPGVNGLWGQNVLSIVVELDKQRLPGTLLAVTGQTIRK